tara:strand:- start:132 stop:974 length:843 start_codon:yes stop_codon:yes gene_type:complete
MFKPNMHHVEGGAGKHIQFTSLFKNIREKYNQKIVISSGFPEIFEFSPHVAYSRMWNHNFFSVETISSFNQYDKIFFKDPYRSDWLKGNTHIVKKWAELYEVEINDIRPDFNINIELEKQLMPHIQAMSKFILLQFTGGQAIQGNLYDRHNWGRNYLYGQELIKLLNESFPNHIVITFGHSNEQTEYQGETKFNNQTGELLFKTREDFMVLSKYCDFFISIDSILQHMCSNKSFNKKGIVLWGATDPNRFGYESNINLISSYPNCVEIEPKKIIDEALKL